ncbi:hypothetical protein, conserved [Babesia ovata]|uniref:C3H1-type domain-containing protein n=1 Tax=Babesia ovata TaxID=189622 RepID=A0A2H6KJE6_9APIC|nr:uncharacterized protein BOVATA_046010 [Babesia ovata]GBE63108.1 hypothetical protein, conserved [Babesia ovata]
MSFLHGVLGGVKDDDNVTKYNDNNDINSVITTLHTAVGKGREAFQAAVAKVGEKTRGVTAELGGQYYHHIASQQERPLKDQLYEWTKTLGDITGDLHKLETNNISELDTSLRTQIAHKVEPIQKSVEVLIRSAGNPELLTQVQAVDDELLKQEEYIQSEIAEEARRVEEQLTEEFEKIWKGIRNVSITKDGHLERVKETIKDAKELLEGMKEYADVFKQEQTFKENVLYVWLDDILNDNTVVNGRLQRYIKGKSTELTGNFEIDPSLRNAIKKCITGALETAKIINPGCEAATKHIEKNGTVQGYIDAVRNGLESFAKELGEKMKEKKHIDAEKVATAIEKEDGIDRLDKDKAHKHYLEFAIRATLPALHFAAKQTWKTLGSFSRASMIGLYLEPAIKKVENIKEQFEDNQKSPGEKIETALAEAKRRIYELGGLLKNESVEGSMVYNLDDIQNVIQKLDDVRKDSEGGKVHERRKEADGLIEELRKRLYKQMENITDIVDDAKRALTKSISDLVDAYNKTRKELKEAIEDLKNNVAHITEDAFKTLTSEVRKLFTTERIADLNALKTLVEQQKSYIEKIIETDKKTGLKGLMPKIYGGAFPKIGTLTTNNKLQDLQETANRTVSESSQYHKKFTDFSGTLQCPTPQVDRLKQQLDTLLTNLKNSHKDKLYHFDHTFTSDLAALNDALSLLTPKQFNGHQHPELLDALTAGAKRLADELGKQYVNRYSGLKWSGLSEGDEARCAKVLLTALRTISRDVNEIYTNCEDPSKYSWKNKTLCETNGDKENPLGQFLQRCGFVIAKKQDSKDGESQCKTSRTGEDIYKNLVSSTVSATYSSNSRPVIGTIEDIFTYLSRYNKIGHLATFAAKRHPCSVNEMLCWLTGLPHNGAFGELDKHLEKLSNDKAYAAVASNIFDVRTYSINKICKYAHTLLTTIAGYGDAECGYACDYSNNSLNLHYPTSGDGCLQILVDIFRRLFLPLRFLQRQCAVSTFHYGWRQCHYGRDVPPYNWQCNTHLTDEAKCQANSQPKCQANSEPNDKPNCRARSPLMSFFTDCLPGHLPHQLNSVGCTSKCSTCPGNKPGMPCLTPLGFRGFSGSVRKGKDICDILDIFFNIRNLATFFCLAPKAPATLPEHFAFSLCLVTSLTTPKSNKSAAVRTLQESFTESVAKQSIDLYTTAANITSALSDAYGSSQNYHDSTKHHVTAFDADGNETKSGDLSSLSMTTTCSGQQCAPYLSTLCHDAYYCLAEMHSNLYLSWALYLPWILWYYLECLCNAFKDIYCQDWGCRSCLQGNKCRRGQHGLMDDKTKNPNCSCSSMVQCKGVTPTLYRYGFSLGAPWILNEKNCPKTCTNFHEQLVNVLKSRHFTELFKTCDEYLRVIRHPFMTTLLALWSLSLLYLLHIAVVRLDVLRIRSHLRSPASHRIAAQSLLAAARVKALANVKYFSP